MVRTIRHSIGSTRACYSRISVRTSKTFRKTSKTPFYPEGIVMVLLMGGRVPGGMGAPRLSCGGPRGGRVGGGASGRLGGSLEKNVESLILTGVALLEFLPWSTRCREWQLLRE